MGDGGAAKESQDNIHPLLLCCFGASHGIGGVEEKLDKADFLGGALQVMKEEMAGERAWEPCALFVGRMALRPRSAQHVGQLRPSRPPLHRLTDLVIGHWPDCVGLWACIRDEMWDILRLSCHQPCEGAMFVQGALTNERGILRRIDGRTLPATWTDCACILHLLINHFTKNIFVAVGPFYPLQWRVKLRFTATAQPPLWPKLCHRT